MVTESEVIKKLAEMEVEVDDGEEDDEVMMDEGADTGGYLEYELHQANHFIWCVVYCEGDKKNKKKKKKKNTKKKKIIVSGSKPPISRVITGFTDYYIKYGQTEVPSKTVAELFPTHEFPEGEVVPHGISKLPLESSLYNTDYDGKLRITNVERREAERILNEETGLYNKMRHAAEVHRQVRHYTQSFIQPGILLTDMCERIEECNRKLVKENGLQAGIGFPTGCSINHVAAHYTPNCGDKTVLQYGDVMKIDFGTQIEGRIIDSGKLLFL
jgi:methionyl aminopeptidase